MNNSRKGVILSQGERGEGNSMIRYHTLLVDESVVCLVDLLVFELVVMLADVRVVYEGSSSQQQQQQQQQQWFVRGS